MRRWIGGRRYRQAGRAEQVAKGQHIACCEQVAVVIMFFSILLDFPMSHLLMSTFNFLC